MNAKEILDKAQLVVKRQDFDRTLGIFLLNTVLKDFIRDNRLPLFDTLSFISYDIYGQISMKRNNIKNIINIEWVNLSLQRKLLTRIKDYESARMNFDFSEVGEPVGYVIIGDIIKILPIPSEGSIEIYAELYSTDLVDSVQSTNAITEEIGNALVYLISGEYFDMLQEEDRGKYWKSKGATLIEKYVRYLKNKQLQNIDILRRDPFGNNPYSVDSAYTHDTDDYDMGTF